jgi:aspartate 4-decarboxylase
VALFSLFALTDERDAYKVAIKRMIRSRRQTLYRELGFDPPNDPNAVNYCAILDLEVLGVRRYGRDFVEWLLRNKNPLEILFRLAEEAGVVLLPGKGFGILHPSALVSLANLDEADYARIGHIIRAMMQEYVDEFHAGGGRSGQKEGSQCS